MKSLLFSLLIFVTIESYSQIRSMESIWDEIAFGKSSCLLGSQYDLDGESEVFRNTIFGSDSWSEFSEHDLVDRTVFLLEKLEDSTKTKVHTCPFFGASNGELAIYALQQIHKTKWYDIPEYSQYKDKETTSATENPQSWLTNLLNDPKERIRLSSYFRGFLK